MNQKRNRIKIIWLVLGLVLFATSVGASQSGPRQSPSGTCITHTVQGGETFSLVAKNYNIPIADMIVYNQHVPNPSLIWPGDLLCVSGSLVSMPAQTRQGATGCSNGPEPGAVAFRDGVQAEWPGLVNLGIFNCRAARGGSSWSTHAEGRAIDFGVPACETQQGQAVARELVARAEFFGIQRVLVCELEWVVGEGWTTPSQGLQDLHNGVKAPAHIHVELTHDAAQALTQRSVADIFHVTRGMAV